MPDITITINALVKDAVDGIKDVSSAMDDQKVTSLQLAQAQRKLEDSLDNLIQAQIKLEQNTDPGKQRELEDAVIDAGVAAQKHQKQVDGLAKEYTQLNTETKSAEMSLADIKAGVDMAGQVVEKVGRVLDATVIKAADWGDSMGDMAQLTGATVRETSTMAATFELMGVEIGTLESAMKTMTKQGLQLNLETLKKLSAEYQAIQDPVAQNEFLFKKFGKAGLEMAEIMGRDAEEIEKLGQAAALSGKVIDEKAAAAAENLNVELEILKQRTEGAAITIGNMLIPTLNEWAAVDINKEWLGPAITGTIELTKAALDTTDAVDRQNERVTALGSATVHSFSIMDEEMSNWASSAAVIAADAMGDLADKAQALKDATLEYSVISGQAVEGELTAYQNKQRDLGAQMADVKRELDELLAVQGKSITVTNDAKYTQAEYALQTQKVAEAQAKLNENTDPEKTLSLTVALEKAQEKANEMAGGLGGISTGIIDNKEKIAELQGKYDDLNTSYDANAEAHALASRKIILGYIEQQLAIDGLTQEEIGYLLDVGEQWGIYGEDTKKVWDDVVQHLKDGALDADATVRDMGARFPSYFPDINFNITGHVSTTGNVPYGAEPGGEAPVIVPDTDTGGTYGGAYSHGTGGNWLTVPSGYPNDSYPVRLESGEKFMVARAGESTSNYGGVTINVNGAGNPQAVAAAVRTELDRMGRSADTRMRTR